MAGQFFHVCTDEDHPLVFATEYDFRSAINILAFCVSMFPGLKLFAFELMSNHIHLLMAGEKEEVSRFFQFFVKSLEHFFKAEGEEKDFSRFRPSFHQIDDALYARNVVAYINKNGCAASSSFTPYNYEWGTGRFFFNPESTSRYLCCRKPVSQSWIQRHSHSRKFDDVIGLYEIDGYVSPLSFCDIEAAESLFQSPRQYLYALTKNVELTKEIAREIGESLTYTDYDLIGLLPRMSSDMFGTPQYQGLGIDQKIQMARRLHFDYNAKNKQICRLLKMDMTTLNNLFPA